MTVKHPFDKELTIRVRGMNTLALELLVSTGEFGHSLEEAAQQIVDRGMSVPDVMLYLFAKEKYDRMIYLQEVGCLLGEIQTGKINRSAAEIERTIRAAKIAAVQEYLPQYARSRLRTLEDHTK